MTALRFVTRHLLDVPVSFVLASRPIPRGHELAGFVDASLRDGALQVTLGPLDEDAVVGLVEDVLGRPPGAGLRSLVASAAGSPFYVTELVDPWSPTAGSAPATASSMRTRRRCRWRSAGRSSASCGSSASPGSRCCAGPRCWAAASRPTLWPP